VKNKSLFRVVFDCMIFLQAVARTKSLANACFTLVKEIEDVLTRPKFRNRFPSLTDEMIEAFLKDVKENAVIVKNVPAVFSYTRDPKDEKYINLAVESEADYIVSRDKDLLDLMTGYTNECKDFRRRFRGLKIVQPIEFLNIVERM
jgi:putative PIN family toxin of toxin-antitoxin system